MVAKASMVLVVVFLLPLFVPLVAGLQVGFYRSTCPQAETIVRNLVQKRFGTDKSITAALLRMHFHDCFVRGCDASILIDSTPQKQSEKAAGPNQSVRGYDLIDSIKSALESACPSRVSCADVVALATRDAVALAGGPTYQLPTGRLDGLTSNSGDVNLPGPTVPVTQAFTQFFRPLGFTLTEMVTLLGAHTVGVAQCTFFQDRVTNFRGTGRPDPTMDPTLATSLRRTCAGGNNPTAFLDQNTSFVVDNSFYREIGLKKGVMLIDQALATDRSTSGIVSGLARNEAGFRQGFAAAMVKMGNLGGSGGGEIRKSCRVFNPKKAVAGNGGGRRPPPKKGGKKNVAAAAKKGNKKSQPVKNG
ncbi:Peroxidase 57 [Linum perenne]